MAFEASNIIPLEAYQTVKRAAVNLKANLTGMKSKLAASGADYEYLQGVYLTLKRADAQFTVMKTTPGLEQFAKDQENNPTYDVAAEFTGMQSEITTAMAWMVSNVPTSVTAKSPDQWDGGVIISNTFSAAQTVGLQSALQGVIDSIN